MIYNLLGAAGLPARLPPAPTEPDLPGAGLPALEPPGDPPPTRSLIFRF